MASRWPKRAVIFDMDGVLFDSVSVHARAYAETFAPLGIDADYRTLAGRRTDEAVRALLATRQVADEKLVAELTAKKKSLAHRYLKEAPPVVDGCAELLSRWKRRHRLALASSASRPNIELFLDASGARSLFDVVLGGADVAESKPHPAIYSRAHRRGSASRRKKPWLSRTRSPGIPRARRSCGRCRCRRRRRDAPARRARRRTARCDPRRRGRAGPPSVAGVVDLDSIQVDPFAEIDERQVDRRRAGSGTRLSSRLRSTENPVSDPGAHHPRVARRAHRGSLRALRVRRLADRPRIDRLASAALDSGTIRPDRAAGADRDGRRPCCAAPRCGDDAELPGDLGRSGVAAARHARSLPHRA